MKSRFHSMAALVRSCSIAVLYVTLYGCGGSNGPPPQYHIGGTIAGLSGTGLVLNDNGTESVSPSSTTFNFASTVTNGTAYAVAVAQQPQNPSQTCTVANASGVVSGADVSSVAVTCVTNSYDIGGTVTGLRGGSLTLENKNGDVATITTDGSFSFPTAVLSGAGYSVDVKAQPVSPSQTCTVTNGTGVVGAAAVNLVVTCVLNYAVRVEVLNLSASRYSAGLVLQNNGSDALSVTGRSAAFAQLIPDGSAFNVTVKAQPTQPTQTCTVTNGTGTIAAADASVAVSCVGERARFVYVSDYVGEVWVFSIAQDGTTVRIQTQSVPADPNSMVVDPSGQFLYVSTQFGGAGIGSVYAFSIDQTSGMLTQIGAQIAESATPNAITVDPTGKFVYVANAHGGATSQGSATVFSTDFATGALSASPTTYTVNYNPYGITVCADLGFLYTANSSGTASAYSIDRSGGALTELTGSPFSAGTTTVSQSIVVSPDGRFAYMSNSSVVGGISAYSRDPASGSLQPLSGSPFAVLGGGPAAMDPLGQFLYLANTPDSTTGLVSSYQVDGQTGKLTAIPTTPTLTSRPTGVAFDPSGMFIYLLTVGGGGSPTGGAVQTYSVDRTSGVLSLLPGSTTATGVSPTAIVVR